MTHTIRLSIRFRWWLKPYLWGVAVMAALMDAQPDMGKVQRAIERAVVLKLERVKVELAA